MRFTSVCVFVATWKCSHQRAVTVIDLPSGTRGPSRECKAGRMGHSTQNAETSHRRRPAPADGRQPSRGSGCHWAPASSQPARRTNEIPQTQCFGTTDTVSCSPGGCKSMIQVPRTQRLPRALCPEPAVLTRPVTGVCMQTRPSGVSACEDTDLAKARRARCRRLTWLGLCTQVLPDLRPLLQQSKKVPPAQQG